MYTKGDFHMHSTFSDGQHSPEELVSFAKNNGVDIIALSDHNNTDGIDRAIVAGEKNLIKVIPAVELSTRYKGTRVHILGYFKDNSYKNEVFVEILRHVRNKNISRIKKIFSSSNKFNWSGDKLSVEIGMEILKFFGAFVVLAHPILLPQNHFEELIKLNFDGIEAKYFLNSDLHTEKYIAVAKEKNIIYTAGSDFHGLKELHRIHGSIGCVYLNQNEIEKFLKALYNNKNVFDE